MLRIAFILLALASPLSAQTITFAPADTAIPNPGRGWWYFAAGDFGRAQSGDLNAVAAEGATVAYGVVRLDDYRDRPLDDALLNGVEAAFQHARNAGVKIILRFAYNYPGSSQEYEDAQDAPLDVVLDHIAQLGPVVRANADTIIVWQAGFIGAWGEAHTSSNGLDSPENKAIIRDAIYAQAPDGMALQWRYPPDILSWAGDTRMGFHNDCFLSSDTDVGTYSDIASERPSQRAAMADLTARTYFSGETCDAQADSIRLGCDAILSEGAEFHLSALNRTYYEAFHQNWQAEGCFDEITRRMGYSLQLVSAEVSEDTLSLTVTNNGWARVQDNRPLTVIADSAALVLIPDLSAIGPGETITATLTDPAIAGAGQLCLAALDPSARLATLPAFAIRPVNADTDDQRWDPATGKFCFTVNG